MDIQYVIVLNKALNLLTKALSNFEAALYKKV